MNQSKSIKVVLVGDADCGKTTYVNMLRTGEVIKKYVPTMGVEVSPFDFSFSDEKHVKINFWDTAGNEKFQGLKSGYYIGADAFIVMFDVCNKKSYKNVQTWIKDIRKVCEDAPIVVCGSKIDKVGREVNSSEDYINLSSYSKYNHHEKPIRTILEKLGKI